jgi:spermidine synthase
MDLMIKELAYSETPMGTLSLRYRTDPVMKKEVYEINLPLGETLTADSRCRLVHGDFFAMAKAGGFDPETLGRKFHAILLDVDHSPRWTLHPSHAWLYEREGLQRLAEHLHPGGAFALWSNDPPDEEFCAVLASVFPETQAHVVTFPNPLQNRDATNTVYTARAN